MLDLPQAGQHRRQLLHVCFQIQLELWCHADNTLGILQTCELLSKSFYSGCKLIQVISDARDCLLGAPVDILAKSQT